MSVHIQISDQLIDPWQLVAKHQQTSLSAGKYGALSLFIGTMRDINLGNEVDSMFIEHYPDMTKKHLADLANRLADEYDVQEVLIIHRVGKLHPSDPIVVIGVWSAHREPAFIVNRKLVEALKTTVPFWKKESLQGNERWVKANV